MLSVATVTPAMGGNYYTKAEENYYTRDQTAQDYWRGYLCEEAGLTSGQQVQAEQFQLMLNNSGSEKCAAYDLTFSAPKSVSIMSETGNSAQHADMLAAHQAAVKATLEQIERREIGARITSGGITEHVHTGKMVCACFEHNISREVDPQLHTHCVIMNRTEYQGKDYAVDGQPLYHIQKVYGTEYRARLATELQERGYAVEITDAEKGFFELSGFKPETIQHFSKRRQQIEEAMQEAVLGKVNNSLDLISKDTREIKTGKARLNAIVKDYLKLSPEEQRKTVVLSAKNADRTALNRQIREGLVKNGQLDKGTVFQVEADKGKPTVAREFAAGDKIVFLQNDLKLGVMNGTKGVIKGIGGERFTVDCGEGKLVQFDLRRYRWIEHGYCLTTFKSQGMTVKRALINMSSKDRLLNSRNAYYVDLSRAKLESKLYIDSREKLESQISKFAQKLTSKDFTFDKETGRFQKVAGKGIPALNGTVGRAVFSHVKGLQMAGELAGLVPVVGKPLQMAMSLSNKAVSLAGMGAKKLERGISELSRAAKTAHYGLQETIRQVQQDKQIEKGASKQKGVELEI